MTSSTTKEVDTRKKQNSNSIFLFIAIMTTVVKMMTTSSSSMMGHYASAFVPSSCYTKSLSSMQFFIPISERTLRLTPLVSSSSSLLMSSLSLHHRNLRGINYCITRKRELQQSPLRLYTASSSIENNRYPPKNQVSSCNNSKNIINNEEKEEITNNNNKKKKDPIKMAEQTISYLVTSRNNRAWRRLSHMVELACISSQPQAQPTTTTTTTTKMTIADIGCDHGLLSVALSSTKYFEKVTGVDVSSNALQNALDLYHDKVLSQQQQENINISPIEFRVGDGLLPLQKGEADVICIAGMGVNTMMKILFQRKEEEEEEEDGQDVKITKLEQLQCQKLVLQPTNSRPRNLIMLYDSLYGAGWRLSNERIEKISSRWYITSSFVRDSDGCNVNKAKKEALFLPGDFLSFSTLTHNDSNDDMQGNIYREYVEHHISWIEGDLKQKGSLCEEDRRWLERNR